MLDQMERAEERKGDGAGLDLLIKNTNIWSKVVESYLYLCPRYFNYKGKIHKYHKQFMNAMNFKHTVSSS